VCGDTLQHDTGSGGVKRGLSLSLCGKRDGVVGCHPTERRGRWSSNERGGGDARQRAGVGVVGRPVEFAKHSECGNQNMTPPYRKKLTSESRWSTSNAIEPKHYACLIKCLPYSAGRQLPRIWLDGAPRKSPGCSCLCRKSTHPVSSFNCLCRVKFLIFS